MMPFGVTGKKWDVLDTSPPLATEYMHTYRDTCIYTHKGLDDLSRSIPIPNIL